MNFATVEDSTHMDVCQQSGWPVSIYPTLFTKQPEVKHLTLEGLARSLCRVPRVATDKNALPLWSPGLLRDGLTRSAVAVHTLSALVLDLDHQQSLDAVVIRLVEVWGGWDFLWHTTWSHEAPNDWGIREAAVRVVFPLKTPCPAELWPALWGWAAGIDNRLDPKCKDPSRIYFVPGVRPGGEWAWGLWGPALDLALWSQSDGLGGLPSGFGDNLLDWRNLALTSRPEINRPVYGPVELPPKKAKRELQERLKRDPATREALAKSLGGTICGAYADNMPCPQCGRRDLWFWIREGASRQAHCKHENSCGWRGWLDQLFEGGE